jgi:glucan phosphorylase
MENLWAQQDLWLAASIRAVGRSARFSADRLARELAAEAWRLSSQKFSC